MVSWHSKVALTGSELWNTSVEKGMLNGQAVFVMAIETRVAGAAEFNTMFATAPDPTGPWKMLDSTHRMPAGVEHACPTIRFVADALGETGWFYLMTGRERSIECTGNSTTPSSNKFFTEIARSRDLVNWVSAPGMGTASSRGGMMTPNASLDKRPAPIQWAPKEAAFVETMQNETAVWDDCNLSDLDLCEYNGTTVIFSCWGINGDPPTPPMRGGLVLSISPMPLSSFLAQWFPSPPAVNASANRQLFFDDQLLEEASGVDIQMHPIELSAEVDEAGFGEELGPVLVPEHPWEGGRIGPYNSIVDNGTHILLYYDVRPAAMKCNGTPPCGAEHTPWLGNDDIQIATCLAISTDGRNFVKPNLGLVAYNGSTANNIVFPTRNRSHPEFVPWSYYPGSVFLDPHGPPQARYKMIANWASLRAAPYNAGSWIFESPDGVKFTPIARVWENSDTQDNALYDPVLRKYVGFRRLGFLGKRACHSCRYGNATPASRRLCGPGEPAGRYVGRCESSDWGPGSFAGCNQPDGDWPQDPPSLLTVFGPDEQDDTCVDIYTNQICDLYEGHYIGFPAAYFHFPNGECENGYCTPAKFGGPGPWVVTNDGTHQTRIAHSNDGRKFSYISGDRRPFLGLGPSGGLPSASLVEPLAPSQPNTWRESMIQAARGLAVRNDSVLLYFWGARCREGQDNCVAWRYRSRKYPHGGDGAFIKVEIRRDGFSSLGSAGLGSFTTKPIVFSGSKMRVNANISIGGEIRVGFLRANGINDLHQFALEQSVPVRGDVMREEVQWIGGSDLSPLAGVTVRLQFRLKEARLHSFWFEGPQQAASVTKSDDGLWSPPRAAIPSGCSSSSQLRISYADALSQVLPGEPSDAGQSTPIGSIKLTAARMQRVDFQLVLRATEGASAARNVTVTVQSAGLAAQITPSVRQVDHANVSLASNAAGRVGLFPDPLPESPHARVSSDGEATAFWITMTAPAHASGQITGSVKVAAMDSGEQLCNVPFRVHVWDFTVPNSTEASQTTDAQISLSYAVPAHHSYDPLPLSVVRNAYTNMLDHRVNAAVFGGVYPPIELELSSDLKEMKLNTSRYDSMVRWLIERGIGSMVMPRPTGCGGLLKCGSSDPVPGDHTARANAVWQFTSDVHLRIYDNKTDGTCEINKRFEKVFRRMYQAVIKHLRSKGWLDRMYVVLQDEPAWDDPRTLCEWVAMAKLYKSLDPSIKIWQDRFPTQYLHDASPILEQVAGGAWISDVPQFEADTKAIAQARAKGTKLYIYANLVPIVDLPPIRTRSFFWRIWQTSFDAATKGAGLQGSLSWYGLSDWETDPYSQANAPYTKAPWFRPAGSGVLLYPPWRGASLLDGVISSIRWEATRAGLEDLEYFVILQRQLTTLRALCGSDRATPNATASRTIARACAPGALRAGEQALQRTHEVVWDWASAGWVAEPVSARRWNISEPYTQNVSLVHSVLDGVAAEVERTDAAMSAIRAAVG